jgi:hypothetical protein
MTYQASGGGGAINRVPAAQIRGPRILPMRYCNHPIAEIGSLDISHLFVSLSSVSKIVRCDFSISLLEASSLVAEDFRLKSAMTVKS